MKRKIQRAGKSVHAGMPTKNTTQEVDYLTCPECSKTFFEEVSANRYRKFHSVVLGQNIPTTGLISFRLLRCLNCKQLVEPDYIATADAMSKRYTVFLKEIEE
jgi:DNA-directed RNA polymerase subunit RPC12/RpoP